MRSRSRSRSIDRLSLAVARVSRLHATGPVKISHDRQHFPCALFVFVRRRFTKLQIVSRRFQRRSGRRGSSGRIIGMEGEQKSKISRERYEQEDVTVHDNVKRLGATCTPPRPRWCVND